MDDARQRTLSLVADLARTQLERVHSPIMSPLAWDLGHIAAYEDLWLAHRYGGLELLRPELADLYDAFETPRALRGEIDALGPQDAKAYMAQVRARTAQVISRARDRRRRAVRDGAAPRAPALRDDAPDAGHRGAARRGGTGEHRCAAGRETRPTAGSTVPKGPFEMGAGAGGFAYDNERPRHVARSKPSPSPAGR